jgi:glycerophosphodiester phosphodiesterase
VENYSNGRAIYFSSFHPDAAILLRREQNSYPVYMLTLGGVDYVHTDARRNSVEAAIDVCLEHGLQGIVSEVLAILKKPQLASQVKNVGLSLFTYGDMNNVAEVLVEQYNLNVDGVIVDCVREIVTASRTLHALLNFVQPDWSQFLKQGTPRDIKIK